MKIVFVIKDDSDRCEKGCYFDGSYFTRDIKLAKFYSDYQLTENQIKHIIDANPGYDMYLQIEKIYIN